MTTISLSSLSDRELIDAVTHAAGDERRATVELIALIGEVDARKLYLSEGCSSPFGYCTQVLRLSEHEAYLRIETARTARRFPIVLEQLTAGALTLTTIAMLGPHLTLENVDALLVAAARKSKREVAHLVASLAPKPDVKPMIRRLPTPQRSITVAGPIPSAALTAESNLRTFFEAPQEGTVAGPPPRSTPLSADRYLLRVTLGADAHAKLKRAQDLLRHSIPSGDPAAVLDRALTLLVADLERRKAAQVEKPRQRAATVADSEAAKSRSQFSRYIPADVRRDVWTRDQGRCAFVGKLGRCTETARLEFHHVEPFACGGAATPANIALYVVARTINSRASRCSDRGWADGSGEMWRDDRAASRAQQTRMRRGSTLGALGCNECRAIGTTLVPACAP